MENRHVISNVPLDHLFDALDDPVEQGGCYNAGVQLCKERATGRVVIRKKFVLGLQDPTIQQARPSDWYREMKILSSLNHKNIVEFVRGYVCAPQAHASMWMEVCDLGSLNDLTKGYILYHLRYIPAMFIWHVTRSLIDAMVYCHMGIDTSPYRIYNGEEGIHVRPGWNSIFHRDLHSGNVFLQSSRTGGYPIVKVGDFGCALSVEEGALHWQGIAGTKPVVGGFELDGGIGGTVGRDMYGIGQIMRMLCYMTTWSNVLPSLEFEVLGEEWPYAFHDMVRLLDGRMRILSAMEALDRWQKHDKEENWPSRMPLDSRAFKRIIW